MLKRNSEALNKRLETRVVKIGDVPLGGAHPVRIQSMTTTDTMDTEGCVRQSIRIIEAGADYVRITAPSVNEALNLKNIKDQLRKHGFKTPLIADIHFTPNAAEEAARIVEKVRINPGNFSDKKKFAIKEYSDSEYQQEIERIRSRFLPLIRICKQYGTAMRLGANHGSLSDRIMNRYGDTPLGMVESALEFVRICEDEGYYDIVLSMKSSNPLVMVQAYRLLVAKMQEVKICYPLHIGVTEAGGGDDGRIKSAVGIGALLEDGIGDTVRVSLTEEPEKEIPVARALVDRFTHLSGRKEAQFKKRETRTAINIGGNNVPRVICDLSNEKEITAATLANVGYHYSPETDKWTIDDNACDFIYAGDTIINFNLPSAVIYNYNTWFSLSDKDGCFPVFIQEQFLNTIHRSPQINFVFLTPSRWNEEFIHCINDDDTVVIILETKDKHGAEEQRKLFNSLQSHVCNVPVIIKIYYENHTEENLLLNTASDFGALLMEGVGNGVWICCDDASDKGFINRTAFGILQATRTRISKTDYISCPSCGRTLFDLQDTTAKIQARTSHLKGVKIGIMGCIVNGPGEMADADYGYVGTGPGKITLYKGKEIVKRNIPAKGAVDELISLIKANADWVEPFESDVMNLKHIEK